MLPFVVLYTTGVIAVCIVEVGKAFCFQSKADMSELLDRWRHNALHRLNTSTIVIVKLDHAVSMNQHE